MKKIKNLILMGLLVALCTTSYGVGKISATNISGDEKQFKITSLDQVLF